MIPLFCPIVIAWSLLSIIVGLFYIVYDAFSEEQVITSAKVIPGKRQQTVSGVQYVGDAICINRKAFGR